MASLASIYCTDNKGKCVLQDQRLKRRAVGFDVYTADQVNLLPGYPKNTSGFVLVAFYVQQPPEIIADVDVIPASTLVEIVNTYKSEIEEAVGANISNVQALFGPTTTKPPEKSSDDWKWIAIGVSVGVVVIIVIIVLAVWCYCGKKRHASVKPEWDEPKEEMNMIHYNKLNMEEGGKNTTEAYHA